jgi:subtilase family serine protease
MAMFGIRRSAVAAALWACSLIALPLAAAAETPAKISPASGAENADFDVYFPLRNGTVVRALIDAQIRPGSPQYHRWLTPQQFQRRFGPTEATIARVTAELAARGLKVTDHNGQQLHVAGTAAAVSLAFHVALWHSRFSDGSEALVADRGLTRTPALVQSGALIPQFSTVPPMHKDSRLLGPPPPNSSSTVGPYFTADLRQAYDFPSVKAVNGKGVTIGILIAGNFNQADITSYFNDESASAFSPKVTSIPINGGLAFSTSNSDETLLDIEQSAGIALGASVELYDLSDLSNPTILFGLNRIVNDNTADVVNMSFGEPEVDLLPANNGGIDNRYVATIYDILFSEGSAQGITFVASSGDHGATPDAGDANTRTLTAQVPATDPFVTAVGGTNLVTAHSSTSTSSAYVSENANPDNETNGEIWGSGGGISSLWGKPSYQSLVPTGSSTLRTIPDLALHMGGCPNAAVKPCGANRSSDWEWLGGQRFAQVGTSAASPDIAGMFALKNKLVGSRLGAENLDIYTRSKNQIGGVGTPFHHAKITGSNGHYKVKAPYDMVIGNGTVDARQFLGATNLAASGNPGTASNP